MTAYSAAMKSHVGGWVGGSQKRDTSCTFDFTWGLTMQHDYQAFLRHNYRALGKNVMCFPNYPVHTLW